MRKFCSCSNLPGHDDIADVGRSGQNLRMKMRQAFGLLFMPISVGCAGTAVDGREVCTVEAIGKETGADSLDATLHVPEVFMTGAEITNGGISVHHDDCDFPLNSFFSAETAEHIIQNAPTLTLSHHEGFFRAVDASLSIWKFSDGSGETRFFVTGVSEMRPISKARTRHEAKYYVEPSNGS